MTGEAVDGLALLEKSGAVLRGHFQLTSGRHSDTYVQKARVLERPDATMALAREMASWYPDGIDVTVAPAVGAVPLGFAVALASGARAIFAEREDGRMALRRGFALSPGERALVVEDVVTTGGSAREVFDLVLASPAKALGVAALVDRSGSSLPFPLRAIVALDAASWPPDDCALCRAGRPLDRPGSRHL
jgi:orotate phosphoribosyltransferase